MLPAEQRLRFIHWECLGACTESSPKSRVMQPWITELMGTCQVIVFTTGLEQAMGRVGGAGWAAQIQEGAAGCQTRWRGKQCTGHCRCQVQHPSSAAILHALIAARSDAHGVTDTCSCLSHACTYFVPCACWNLMEGMTDISHVLRSKLGF